MNYFTTFMTLAQWLPTIRALILQAEKTAADMAAEHSVTLTGQQKLQLVLGFLQPLYDKSNPQVPFDEVISVITSFVSTIVTLYNTLGLFTKKTA